MTAGLLLQGFVLFVVIVVALILALSILPNLDLSNVIHLSPRIR